jgi:hypothetical protein
MSEPALAERIGVLEVLIECLLATLAREDSDLDSVRSAAEDYLVALKSARLIEDAERATAEDDASARALRTLLERARGSSAS